MRAASTIIPKPENEADRQALNEWMRHSGVFDAVADFDAALRDPAHPDRIRKDYDSGDGLHPSLAGYRAIADAVPLAALRRQCGSAK
jgi:lysophospholipase L1-like esterase